MILITTSRRPTRMMRTFCNDLANTIPSLKRVNRGKMSSHEISEKAIDIGADKVLIIDRWKGRPGRIRFFEVKDGLYQIPPQIYIRGVKFRREFNVKRIVSRKVFIDISEEKVEIQRLGEMLSGFFELPVKVDEKSGSQKNIVMRLSSELDNVIRVSFYQMPKNMEIGPRIRISHAVWKI